MADNVVPFSTPDGLTAATLFVSGGATFASRIQGVGATFTGTVEIDTGLILPNGQTITSAVTTVNGLSGSVTSIAVTGANTFTGLQTMNAGITSSALYVSGGATFAGTVSSDTGYRISSSTVNGQTGTSYSLTASDNGKIITMSNGATSTVTIIAGLPVGFNSTIIQLGTGQVGFTAASGVTLNSYASAFKISGQHGAAGVISYSSNVYNISGTLSV